MSLALSETPKIGFLASRPNYYLSSNQLCLSSFLHYFCIFHFPVSRFFSLFFVYLIAGVAFMKFVKKAEGKEVVPNVNFWTALPELIKVSLQSTINPFDVLVALPKRPPL